MGAFLYYLPTGLQPHTWLESRRSVFGPDATISERATSCGPDGKAGLVCAVQLYANRPIGVQVGYYPARQTWKTWPDFGWQVGIDTDHPPKCEDVIRSNTSPGHPVRLESEETYIIPPARLVNGGTALPQVLDMGEGGRLTPVAHPRYGRIIAQADELWQLFDGHVDGQAVETDWQLAVDALALNYHLGTEEVAALGLLSTQSATEVIGALIDLPRLRAIVEAIKESAEKKSDADTQATSPIASGATGSAATTPPPVPTLNYPHGGIER